MRPGTEGFKTVCTDLEISCREPHRPHALGATSPSSDSPPDSRPSLPAIRIFAPCRGASLPSPRLPRRFRSLWRWSRAGTRPTQSARALRSPRLRWQTARPASFRARPSKMPIWMPPRAAARRTRPVRPQPQTASFPSGALCWRQGRDPRSRTQARMDQETSAASQPRRCFRGARSRCAGTPLNPKPCPPEP